MCICYVYFRRSIFSFGFSFRHVVSDKGSSSDTCIRVRNLQLGVSTVWSLEKFESKLAAMKELYEVCSIIKISINFRNEKYKTDMFSLRKI